jgi:hypothetical protein
MSADWEKEAAEGLIRNAYLEAELEATCLRAYGEGPPWRNGLVDMVRNALGITIGPGPDFKVDGPRYQRDPAFRSLILGKGVGA